MNALKNQRSARWGNDALPISKLRLLNRPGKGSAWTRVVRRAFFIRMWSETGSLYAGKDLDSDSDVAAWVAPSHLARAPVAIRTWHRYGYGERSPFELEHLLSLGVLGLHRDPSGVIRSRFPQQRLCRSCYGLSWRVDGEQCRCGLQHRQECA